MHLALVDQALLALVNELDRVLYCQDMAVLGIVFVVHHRGKGRRFTRTCRTGHQHQTAWIVADVLENRRAVEFFQAKYLRRNRTENRGGTTVLVERIDTEPSQPGDLKREIHLEELLVILALLVVHDVVNQLMNALVVEHRHVDAPDVAVHADHRRQPGRKVQIRCIVFDAKGEELSNIHSVPATARNV